MGNINIEGKLRLRPQTAFSAILEGGKTFAELAPDYGFTSEAFEAEVLAKVGPKEFARLKKESERNEAKKAKKQQKAQATKKTTKKNITEEDSTMKKEKVVTRETLLRQKENAQREIETATAVVDAEAALLEAEGKKVETAEKDVSIAEAALTAAKNVLKDAKKAFQKQERILKDKKDGLSKWQTCLSIIDKSIQELDAKLIYLVAPGYQGELPSVGKLISVVPFEGANVEVEQGGELYKEPTSREMFSCGYKQVDDVMNAYNFAGLVIKYELNDVDVTVLVDDDRIKRILKTQEVGF